MLGIHMDEEKNSLYAVDVAFHESGLNYGLRLETTMKVVEKIIRTAFCLYGYFDAKTAEIVFASPKIHKTTLSDLSPCITFINDFFKQNGFDFRFSVICNEEFEKSVLNPILHESGNVADTNELFMRAYQMYAMFHPNRDNK